MGPKMDSERTSVHLEESGASQRGSFFSRVLDSKEVFTRQKRK